MTLDILLVLLIALGAMVLFITEKLRVDAIAILVLVSLTLLDLISPGQALSGFSNQATITVAAMFILAAGLQNSGTLAAAVYADVIWLVGVDRAFCQQYGRGCCVYSHRYWCESKDRSSALQNIDPFVICRANDRRIYPDWFLD